MNTEPSRTDEWLEQAKAADTSQLAFLIVEAVIMANSAFEARDMGDANLASKRAAMLFGVFAQKLGAGVIMVTHQAETDKTATE